MDEDSSDESAYESETISNVLLNASVMDKVGVRSNKSGAEMLPGKKDQVGGTMHQDSHDFSSDISLIGLKRKKNLRENKESRKIVAPVLSRKLKKGNKPYTAPTTKQCRKLISGCSEDEGKAPATSEVLSPKIPMAADIMIKEIQSSLQNIISIVSDIKSTQLMHTLKIDSMKENTMKSLEQVTKGITSLYLLVDQLKKDHVTVSALFQTQDMLIKQIDFVHTSISKRMDLMQEQVLNAISQVSSEVRLLSNLIAVDKTGEEEEQLQSKKRSSQPTDQGLADKRAKK